MATRTAAGHMPPGDLSSTANGNSHKHARPLAIARRAEQSRRGRGKQFAPCPGSEPGRPRARAPDQAGRHAHDPATAARRRERASTWIWACAGSWLPRSLDPASSHVSVVACASPALHGSARRCPPLGRAPRPIRPRCAERGRELLPARDALPASHRPPRAWEGASSSWRRASRRRGREARCTQHMMSPTRRGGTGPISRAAARTNVDGARALAVESSLSRRSVRRAGGIAWRAWRRREAHRHHPPPAAVGLRVDVPPSTFIFSRDGDDDDDLQVRVPRLRFASRAPPRARLYAKPPAPPLVFRESLGGELRSSIARSASAGCVVVHAARSRDRESRGLRDISNPPGVALCVTVPRREAAWRCGCAARVPRGSK
ncbi:hypothetical protein BC628DRAFT_1396588 [Trametes gibbosa]|nr:hypothetical protein BC628DRAFT_1396588 [Trametes gibbosa]